MKKEKLSENIFIQIIPLFLMLIIFLLTQKELFVSLGVILLIGITLLIHYEKNEWKVILLGIILGIAFELGGDLIYKAQYWDQGSFLGIPYWLPIMWGYGFLLIRRIGNKIIKQ